MLFASCVSKSLNPNNIVNGELGLIVRLYRYGDVTSSMVSICTSVSIPKGRFWLLKYPRGIE